MRFPSMFLTIVIESFQQPYISHIEFKSHQQRFRFISKEVSGYNVKE